MSQENPVQEGHGTAYNLFIIALTLLSLLIMVALVLPISSATRQLLTWYDNLICIIFLIDFFGNLRRASTKRAYFIGERGWLDLLGSIPSFGFFKYTALFRLARLSRLARLTKLSRNKNKRDMLADVLDNRGQYAMFITLMMAFIVLVVCSTMVLQFESKSPKANIATGGEALWWSIVTITTVGYGDFYPVTAGGRIVGVIVMVAGVAIIASLASLLTSIIIPPPKSAADAAQASQPGPAANLSPEQLGICIESPGTLADSNA